MVRNPFRELSVVLQAEDKMSGVLDNATKKLGSFKTAATAAGAVGGAALTAGFGKSISAAADFDSAMTESLAIMGDVSDTMEEDLAQTAQDVAEQTTFSAEEAAESYYYLASAGLDASESMEALPEVANFAQAGMFDMAEATDILTDAQSALGEETVTLADLSDKLVKANTLANASVEQFGSALTNKAAPAMRRMGVEVDEGIAALSVFADQGLKGDRAGTILARTIEGLADNANENAEAFEELGVEVYDSEGNMRDLEDIIADLEDALGDMSTEQRQAALEQLGFNRRAQQGLDLLIGNSEQLGEYESELQNAGGTTEEVAKKQLDTFNNQLSLKLSRLRNIAITIGQSLLPALTDLLKGVDPLLDQFQGLVENLSDAQIQAAAVGSAFLTLGSTLALLASGPVGALTLAVGALASAWVGDFGDIRQTTERVLSAVDEELRTAAEGVRALAEGDFGEAFDKLGEAVTGVADTVRDFDWEGVGNDIVSSIGDGLDFVEETAENVMSFLNDLETDIKEHDWADVGAAVGDSILDAVSFAEEAISGFISDLETTLDEADWSDAGDTAGDAIAAALGVTEAAVEALSGFTSGLGEKLSELDWGGVGDTVGDAIAGALDLTESAIEDLGAFASTLGTKLDEVDWGDVGETVGDAIGAALGLTESGVEKLSGFVSTLKTKFDENVDWSDVGETVGDAIGAAIDLTESGVEKLGDYASTLKTKFDENVDWGAVGDTVGDNIAGALDTTESAHEDLQQFAEGLGTSLDEQADWTAPGETVGGAIAAALSLPDDIQESLTSFVSDLATTFEETDWSEPGRMVAQQLIDALTMPEDAAERFNQFTKEFAAAMDEVDWTNVGRAIGAALASPLVLGIIIEQFKQGMIQKFQETDWGEVGQSLGNALATAAEADQRWRAALARAAFSLAKAIANFFVEQATGKTIDQWLNGIRNWIDATKTYLQEDAWDDIKEGFFTFLNDWATNGWQEFKSWLIDGGESFVQGLFNTDIHDYLNDDAWGDIKEGAESVLNDWAGKWQDFKAWLIGNEDSFIKSLFNSVSDWLKNEGKEKIKNAMGELVDALKSTWNNAVPKELSIGEITIGGNTINDPITGEVIKKVEEVTIGGGSLELPQFDSGDDDDDDGPKQQGFHHTGGVVERTGLHRLLAGEVVINPSVPGSGAEAGGQPVVIDAPNDALIRVGDLNSMMRQTFDDKWDEKRRRLR